MRIDSLTPMQLDALREVGSIGAGHAATALSQLVDRPVTLEVPTIEVVGVASVPHVFGGPEQLVFAVYSRLLGDVEGSVLFLVPREAALTLTDLLHGREVGTATAFGADEEALLRHVASILISAYLAAIARMAGLDILPSSPAMAFDMAGALLEAVFAEVGMRADSAVLVRTLFLDEACSVEGALFFLPDPDSLTVMLERLGMA
jgi:chemotaxis protein CheC